MNFSAPGDGINSDVNRGLSGRLYPSIDSLMNSDLSFEEIDTNDSDTNSCADSNTSLGTPPRSRKFLYPQKEYVDHLQPEEVRWFYKKELDKKWTAFIGYDSLRIECRYRVQLQHGNEDLTEAEVADLDQILVRGGLYEVDVPKRVCRPVYWSEYLYTGTADGRIVVIHKGQVRELTRLGEKPCGRFEDEPTCGRPLGMRIDKDGYLIVADAYLGLFKINVATGDHTLLLPSSVPINGRVPKFLNDFDFGPDGTIYMSDSSTVWERRNNRYSIMEAESSGRLFAYYPTTNTTEELVTGIAFANGVQLSKDKKSVLLASTTKAAIYRYYIDGPKKGKLETFNDNLPGLPDNIRRSKSLGGYWVGIAAVRKPTFSAMDFLCKRPWITKTILKIFSQEVIIKLLPKYGLLLHLNDEGEITHSLHDPSGSRVPSLSEAEESAGVLYLGSYQLPFISKIYISDIKKTV